LCRGSVPSSAQRRLEQHLDLPKLAASRTAQLGASAPKIVRREARNANLSRVLARHLPDDFLAQVFAPDALAANHGSENVPFGDAYH
jgi:hypothetical protein